MKKVMAMLAVVALSACVNDTPVSTKPAKVSGQDQAMIISGLKDGLRDPESAQFRDWQGYQLSNGQRVVCVQLNARNGFGGYVGYQQHYIRLGSAGEVISMQIDDMATVACRDAAANTLKINSSLG